MCYFLNSVNDLCCRVSARHCAECWRSSPAPCLPVPGPTWPRDFSPAPCLASSHTGVDMETTRRPQALWRSPASHLSFPPASSPGRDSLYPALSPRGILEPPCWLAFPDPLTWSKASASTCIIPLFIVRIPSLLSEMALFFHGLTPFGNGSFVTAGIWFNLPDHQGLKQYLTHVINVWINIDYYHTNREVGIFSFCKWGTWIHK